MNNIFVFNPGDWNSLSMIMKYAGFRFFIPRHDVSYGDVNRFFGSYGDVNRFFGFHVFTFFLVGPLGLEPRTDGL